MLVAVTAKVPAVAPAVKSPAEEIVPPVADQLMPVFDVPETVAENCWVLPVWTEAEGGLMATEMTDLAGALGTDPGESAVPAQPARLSVPSKTHRKRAPRGEGYGCLRGGWSASWKPAS